jgi:hypothetical protein
VSKVWFERFSTRLAWELADFERRGLAFALDEDERRLRRRIVLRGAVKHGGEDIELTVVYPDTFPYFRPEVLAPDLKFSRHRNPFEGNLCLLDRSTRAWDSDWSGARLVTERVPLLLDLLEAGGDQLLAGEVPQGEPMGFYYPPRLGSAVFVPEAALRLPRDVQSGRAVLAFGAGEQAGLNLRALMTEISTKERKRARRLARVEGPLAERFSGGRLDISWVRLGALPRSRDPRAFFQAAAKVADTAAAPRWQTAADGDVAVLGVVYDEEVRQGVYEDSWLFAVLTRGRGPHAGQTVDYLTRGERLSRDYLQERIPGASALTGARIAIAGLGGIGAGLAMELARSQARELRLLDRDRVESGNIVRWPLGVPAIGYFKGDALAAAIQEHYPLTDIWKYYVAIGMPGSPNAADAGREYDLLDHFLDGADVLIDATAEVGVGQLLADLAEERNIPVVIPWATEGLYGGAVAVVDPPRTGCWMCLQHHLFDGTISLPPRSETGTVQPRGCATPTFTGSSFELLTIIAQAARATVRVLDGERDGVAMLALHDGRRPLPAPSWRTFALTEHQTCRHSSSVVAA